MEVREGRGVGESGGAGEGDEMDMHNFLTPHQCSIRSVAPVEEDTEGFDVITSRHY